MTDYRKALDAKRVEIREQIDENFQMGFINYQDFVEQTADTLDYTDRKIIEKEVQGLLDSDYVFELRRELQRKIDDALFENDIIKDILSKY
jgi:hypothetical protein